MSVKSATEVKLTATIAEPPKTSAPSQPWQATGLTYYHNKYVNQAADLGCCGVTHLLIFADSSLAAKVGKIALFAIVSLGFAMVDVIRAAWTKISGSRTVAPIAPITPAKPTTTTPAAPASTSTTEASSKPADTAKLKPTDTADESNAEKTQEEEPEANPPSSAPSYDPKAIKELTKQEYYETNILAGAIGGLQDKVSQRPTTTELTEAILQVRGDANTAAKKFAEASSSHQAALKKTSKEMEALKKSLFKLNAGQEAFVTAAAGLYPEEIFAAAPEFFEDVPPPSLPQPPLAPPPQSAPPLVPAPSSSSSSSASSLASGPPQASGNPPTLPPQQLFAPPPQSSPSLVPAPAPSSSSASSFPSAFTLPAAGAPTQAPQFSFALHPTPSDQGGKISSHLGMNSTYSPLWGGASPYSAFASSGSSSSSALPAQDNSPFSFQQPPLFNSSKFPSALFTPPPSGPPKGTKITNAITQLKEIRARMELLGREMGVPQDELSTFLKRRDMETNLDTLQRLQKQEPLWTEYVTLQQQITGLCSSLKQDPSPIWKTADQTKEFIDRLQYLRQQKVELEQQQSANGNGSASS